MVLSIKNNWNKAKADHKLYVTDLVKKALEVKFGKQKYIKSFYLRKFLKKNLNTIAVGNANQLRQLINEAEKLLKRLSKQNRDTFEKECKRVLSYSGFIKKNTNKWNAYKLCKKSIYCVCPYCDQSFLFTVEEGESAYRPTLDHYYSKDLYPYLAVSLYNLIPSCYVCNSNLKGAKDFYKVLHLNPFVDDEIIDFRIDTDSFDNFIAAMHDAYTLTLAGRLVANDSQNSKAAKSIETFVLSSRYENHLYDFANFIKLKRNYTPDRIKLINEIMGETLNEAEMLRFDIRNYKNSVLGKIYKDLYFQFS